MMVVRTTPISQFQLAAPGHRYIIKHHHSLIPSAPRRIQLVEQSLTYQYKYHPHFNFKAASSTSASDVSIVENEASPDADNMIQDLLSLLEASDRGALLDDRDRRKVEELITTLEKYCIQEPLQSPLLFGDWDVVYSSNPTSTGGYYRSSLARALLTTKQMVQSLGSPNQVRNEVSFSALNLVDGEVSLEGTLEPLDEKSIKVVFNPPKLKLGSLQFQYGGNSSVQISVIYLDEKIRLGRGSRGSLFVFKRRI